MIMAYSEKCFASVRQSLSSKHVRQNINYIGSSGFFEGILIFPGYLSDLLSHPNILSNNSATTKSLQTMLPFSSQPGNTTLPIAL